MKSSVGLKISAGFALALLFLIVIGGVSYSSTNKLTETSFWVTHTHEVLGQLDGLFRTLMEAEAGQRDYLLTSQESYLEPLNRGSETAGQFMDKIQNLTSDNPKQQRAIERLRQLVQKRFTTLKEMLDVQKVKDLDAAKQASIVTTGKQEMSDIRTIIGDMQDEESGLLKIRNEEAADSAQRAKSTILLGTIAAFVIMFLAAFVITRNISVPLRKISLAAERIAAGDLSGSVATDHRQDEVGVLTHTFSTMVVNLQKLISQTTEGINVLSTSANQISTSTTQLASSATQTATAVSEATTTVEEVRQTAQLSSQKSKAVSETAQKMAQISQSGTKSTEETIGGINRIRQQMSAIAESMMRLSEQSQTIGQIVATVEDLAAQSNILAVNAAIEAAKAGEHGRGFAMVAQEVRSLAEQSKQATNQVRTILTDIQKATSGAVIATEQGSKAVEAGVKQAGDAGQSIQTLSSSVAEAAQTATQIAASSQQQLAGVDQVASAMESIKQASTQNVTSAKQLEAAAHSLKELGGRLKQTVEKYRV